MKIAHVTAHLSNRAAGVKVMVESLSRAQALAGHDVRVFGVADADWKNGEDALWEGALPVVSRAAGPAAFGYAPDMIRNLTAFDPTVVHLHGIWMYPGYAVLKWHQRTGKPFVLSIHGMMWREASAFSPIKKRIVRTLFQNRVFARAAVVHVTSTSEAEDVRHFGLSNNLVNVKLGMDVPDLAHIPPTTGYPPTVLALGRLHPKKGLDRLVDAWASIEPSFPNWQLRLVGPDEIGTKAKLEAQINELSLKKVSIEDPVFGDAKWRLLRDAEVFVLPSRNENFAFTVPESLAAGTPVISTKGAPWSGLEANDCGWWVEQGSAPLRDALYTAMSLPAEERRIMGRKGREWIAREYSWARIGAELVEIYMALA